MTSADLRADRAILETPLAEAFYLPLASTLVAGSLAAVFLRFAAIISGMATGWLPYFALFFAAAAGATATSLCGVLDLPKSLRLVDSLLVLILGALLPLLGPAHPGTVRLGGRIWSVSPLSMGLVAICFAWFFGTSLAWVVPKLYPSKLHKPDHDALAERMEEQEVLREVYRDRDALAARVESWRSAYQVILTIFLVYLVPTFFWVPAGRARTDLILSIWSATALAGVLAFLGLVHLASRRRMAERSAGLTLLPGYSRAWALAVFLPTAVAAAAAMLLPSDISPLAFLDWNAIMDRFTRWLVAWGFAPTPNRWSQQWRPFAMGETGTGGSSPGVYGGSGGVGPIGIIIVVAIPLAVYVIWRGIRGAARYAAAPLQAERERANDLWAILLAIVTFPWRALSRFWRRSTKMVAEQGHEEKLTERSRRGVRSRRAKAHPQDPSLFVRHVYRRMLQAASRAGMRRLRHETALEFAQTLAQSIPDVEVPVEELTSAYCDVRYTGRPPETGVPSRVVSSLRSVVRGLRSVRRA